MIRVFIVDDHPAVAEGLSALLAKSGEIDVIGIENEGEVAIHRILSETPDVVLQDLNLSGISGATVMKEVLQINSRIKFLMFTVLPENSYALQLIEEGASGFLNKNTRVDEMVAAIRSVSLGKIYMSHELRMLKLEQKKASDKQGIEKLSKREREIFMLLAAGKRQVDIEAELDIGHSTMSTYVARIKRKLGVKTIAEIVRYATTQGIETS